MKEKTLIATTEVGKIIKIPHPFMILTILGIGIEGNLKLIKEIYEKPMWSLSLMLIMAIY